MSQKFEKYTLLRNVQTRDADGNKITLPTGSIIKLTSVEAEALGKELVQPASEFQSRPAAAEE